MTSAIADKPVTTAARLWGPRHLAELFHVSEPTVKLWEQAGRIPKAVRIGHKMFWSREAIERFIAGE